MAQYIVGIFENALIAQSALENLVKAGFPHHSIDVSGPQSVDGIDTADLYPVEGDADPVGIGSLVNSLVAVDEGVDGNHESSAITPVDTRKSFLTVETSWPNDGEWVVDLLREQGAIEVHKRDKRTF